MSHHTETINPHILQQVPFEIWERGRIICSGVATANNTHIEGPPSGSEYMRVGDVFKDSGRFMVCIRVNESAAVLRPLTKVTRTIEPRGDKKLFGGKAVTFSAPDNSVERISPIVTTQPIARLGLGWADADFSKVIPGFTGEPNVVKQKNEAGGATVKPPRQGGGKCAFLWSLLENGEHTKSEMVKLAVEKFGGTLEGTARTLSAIPSAMRKVGKQAKWKEA